MNKPTTNQKTLLRVTHVVAGFLHIASGILLLVLGLNEDSLWSPVTRLYYETWTRDTSCLSKPDASALDRCFTLSQDYHAYSVSIITILVLFGVWSGLSHLATASPYYFRSIYLVQFEEGRSTIRWFDYVISSPLMIVVIAIYSGIVDIWLLVTIGVGQVVVIITGGLSEFYDTRPDKGGILMGWTLKTWLYLLANLVYVVIVWLPIIGTFTSTMSRVGDSDIDLDLAFVWVIFSALGAVFSSFGIVFALYHLLQWITYATAELSYISLSLAAKTILHWTLYYSLFQRTTTLSNEVYDAGLNKLNIDTDKLLPVISGTAGGGLFLAVALPLIWRYMRNKKPTIGFETKAIPSGGVAYTFS